MSKMSDLLPRNLGVLEKAAPGTPCPLGPHNVKNVRLRNLGVLEKTEARGCQNGTSVIQVLLRHLGSLEKTDAQV